MKTFLKSLVLMLASIVVTLFLCELLIRIAAPQRLDSNLTLYEQDDKLVFKMRKNYNGIYSNIEFEVPVATNSDGFRDREFQPKTPGTYRIIGVGDSYTFANGVRLEETYLKRLEVCLKGTFHDSTEIDNLGVPAYGPSQYSTVVQTTGVRLGSNMVIMGFFVGNDFVDSGDLYNEKGEPSIRVDHGQLVSNKPLDSQENIIRRLTASIRMYLSTRSHLYVFFRNRSSELLARLGLKSYNMPPEFCEAQYSPRMTRHWNITRQVLDDLAAFTTHHQIRLLVVIIPTIYQVYPKSWNEYISGLHLDPSRYDLDKPQKMLTEYFRNRNIEYLDMLPIIRAHANEARLFYPVDGHLTADGHKLIGETLCGYLTDFHSETALRLQPESANVHESTIMRLPESRPSGRSTDEIDKN